MKQCVDRRYRKYVVVGAVALVMLAAAVVSELTVASNMAFKLNKAIGAGQGLFGVNYVALPFRTPISNAKQVCQVFGTVSPSVLIQKLTGVGAPQNHTCDLAVDGFPINDGGAPGLPGGFGLRIQNTGVPLTGIIVGSHIPGGGPAGSYTQPAAGLGFIGRKLYAVPYHSTADTAADICVEGGLDSVLPGVAELQRIDTPTGTPFAHTCDLAVAGFPLVLGEAIRIQGQPAAVVWTPAHF